MEPQPVLELGDPFIDDLRNSRRGRTDYASLRQKANKLAYAVDVLGGNISGLPPTGTLALMACKLFNDAIIDISQSDVGLTQPGRKMTGTVGVSRYRQPRVTASRQVLNVGLHKWQQRSGIRKPPALVDTYACLCHLGSPLSMPHGHKGRTLNYADRDAHISLPNNLQRKPNFRPLAANST
jgi:hypothetical protein